MLRLVIGATLAAILAATLACGDDASGRKRTCRPGDDAACDDGLDCTADACTSEGRCTNAIGPGSCLIHGACYGLGDVSTTNTCLGCDPSINTGDWTVRIDGTVCDGDGDGCTVGDICVDGACFIGWRPSCTDGASCTQDTCESLGPHSFQCNHAPPVGQCVIDGKCWDDAEVNPASECQWCDPDLDVSAWTHATMGTPCGEGATPCSAQDTCAADGSCAPNHLAEGLHCGDGPTVCSAQDDCDGQGNCRLNHLNVGTDCGECRSCNHVGVCATNSVDHIDCPACEACSDGVCAPQGRGDDLKFDCDPVDCTAIVQGWLGGSCRAFAGTGPLNGFCDGASACITPLDGCSGIGADLYTCNVNCTNAAKCQPGQPAVNNDSAAEVCAPDNTVCGTGYVCVTGECLLSGSCPILYAWDGTEWSMEADVFPSGKLGLRLAGGFRKPYPHDNYLLRSSLVERSGGFLELRLVEERHETNYLDQVRLFAVDVAEDRDVISEILSVLPGDYLPPEALLHTIGASPESPLSAVRLDTGEDVAAALAATDASFVMLNEDNNSFEWRTIEIDLGDLAGADAIKLIVDSRTVFPTTPAGYQVFRDADPSNLGTRLEVVSSDGAWVEVSRDVAILTRPKEFSRVHVIDLTNAFVTSDWRLRLSFLMKTYVNAVLFDTTADAPMTITEVPLVHANLHHYGFSAPSSQSDNFVFLYGQPDARLLRLMPGRYTSYGTVTPLLDLTDDMFVIFGTGDEISMSFLSPRPPKAKERRRYVFYSNGYYKAYKNADIAHFVEPLPFGGMSNFPYDPAVERYPDDVEHQQYLDDWNARVE